MLSLTVHHLLLFDLLMDFLCICIMSLKSLKLFCMNSNLLRANGQGNIEAWELVSFFCKILGTPSLDFFVRLCFSCFIVDRKEYIFLTSSKLHLLKDTDLIVSL
jgi:hypothetical protein